MNFTFKCFALLCVGVMTAGTAAADTIEGTFVQADTSNTFDVATGVSPLSVGWQIGEGTGTAGPGFNLLSLAPNEIVTQVGGLNPGDIYNVAFVYSNLNFFSNDNLAAGTVSGALTNVPDNHANVVGGPLTDLTSGNGSVDVYDLNLGPATVDSNGDLSVFVKDSSATNSGAFFLAHNGISYDFVSAAAVPEPSSLALLGLMGGLGLLRRRR